MTKPATQVDSAIRFLLGAVLGTSVLQGIFSIIVEVPPAYRAAGLAVAAIDAILALAGMRWRNVSAVALLLWVAQFGMFLWRAAAGEVPPETRLLVVGLWIIYVASWLVALAVFAKILHPTRAIWLAILLGSGLWITEATIKFGPERTTESKIAVPALRRVMISPHLESANPPNTTMEVYYRGDSKGYFEETETNRSAWWLRAAGGSAAKLVFGDPDITAANITTNATGTTSDIQLNKSGFRVQAKVRYAITFWGRAVRSREVTVGFARSHGGWENLGFTERVGLTTQSKKFEMVFTATDDDDNARIHFDVGGDAASVEFAGVQLRQYPDGPAVTPMPPGQSFVVNYRFNSMGCRGPEYTNPKPGGTTRLLLLGNAAVLGEGIREEATVSAKLGQLLNADGGVGSGQNFEAINCGASGYGIREERNFYDAFGARYQPDVVLLGVTWQNSESCRVIPSGIVKQGSLFRTFAALSKQSPAPPDFQGCTGELRQLNEQVRRQGGRLLVFIFRNNADLGGTTESGRIWNQLKTSLTASLGESHIPVLELGTAFNRQGSGEDLRGHASLAFAPNESAHQTAAVELLGFIRQAKVVPALAGF